MYLTEIEWEGVDSVHLVQDKDRWQAILNVMNIWIP